MIEFWNIKTYALKFLKKEKFLIQKNKDYLKKFKKLNLISTNLYKITKEILSIILSIKNNKNGK
jgi:hypothetical protein